MLISRAAHPHLNARALFVHLCIMLLANVAAGVGLLRTLCMQKWPEHRCNKLNYCPENYPTAESPDLDMDMYRLTQSIGLDSGIYRQTHHVGASGNLGRSMAVDRPRDHAKHNGTCLLAASLKQLTRDQRSHDGTRLQNSPR